MFAEADVRGRKRRGCSDAAVQERRRAAHAQLVDERVARGGLLQGEATAGLHLQLACGSPVVRGGGGSGFSFAGHTWRRAGPQLWTRPCRSVCRPVFSSATIRGGAAALRRCPCASQGVLGRPASCITRRRGSLCVALTCLLFGLRVACILSWKRWSIGDQKAQLCCR